MNERLLKPSNPPRRGYFETEATFGFTITRRCFMQMRNLALLGAIAMAGVATTAYTLPSHAAVVGVSISVGRAPPPPRVEHVPPPRPGYVWATGYWSWNGGRYVWVSGRWHKGRPGYVYHKPYWTHEHGHWVFHNDYWAHDPHPHHDNGHHDDWNH
jgi:WXXGXW repeat (2 copies)